MLTRKTTVFHRLRARPTGKSENLLDEPLASRAPQRTMAMGIAATSLVLCNLWLRLMPQASVQRSLAGTGYS